MARLLGTCGLQRLPRLYHSLPRPGASPLGCVRRAARRCPVGLPGPRSWAPSVGRADTKGGRCRGPHSPEGRSVHQDTSGGLGPPSPGLSRRRAFRNTAAEVHEWGDGGGDAITESEVQSEPLRRNTTYWYFLRCKELIKNNKLSEALVMFETRMLKEEQLPPEEYNYTVLIGGCGRAGYLKKAIRLYNDMKKRAIIPSEATYTALFNACAESPWKHSGLQFVIKLREELKRKNIQANLHTYHSMLKAFAICSDLRACFQVLQEIVHSGHEVNEITFSNLMIGCINDTENGFRCLLQIWRQMLKLGIRPDAKSYNLLLRGARDCGIGEPSMASRLLLDEDDSVRSLQQRRKVRRLKGQKEKHKEKSTGSLDVDLLEQQIFADVPLLPEDGDKARGAGPTARINPESTWKPVKAPEPLSSPSQENKLLQREEQSTDLVPATQIFTVDSNASKLSVSGHSDGPLNLLDLQVHKGNVISLGAAGRPCDRLALIGNLSGLLGKMKADGVRPDIKTFTLLVDVMDLENDSESSLLTLMDEHGVKADISFFNTLVRKRSKMGDLEGAKAVIRLLTERSLTPNMYTFCNLAIACRKSCDGLQLLSDMKMSGVIPNVNVYSTLINAAAKQLDYVFLIDVLRDMARNQVSPNQVVLRQLEFAASYPPKFDRYKSKNTYLEKIDGFRGFYYQWLTWMPVAETPHPWERYRIKKVSSTQEDQPNQSDVKTTTTKLRPEKKKKSKVH